MMKDVVSCDKLRGAAAGDISVDLRMRKLGWGHAQPPISEYIGYVEITQGIETSQYLEEQKLNKDSLSSGERKGNSPNCVCAKLTSVAYAELQDLQFVVVKTRYSYQKFA